VAQIEAVESELRAAELVAEGTESEVQFGLKTLLDLLDAEHELSNAELRFVQAQQDLIVNSYNLMRSTGELSVSQFALEITPPALDSIFDPPSRYPYIIPLMVK
jgi:outer membrane protein